MGVCLVYCTADIHIMLWFVNFINTLSFKVYFGELGLIFRFLEFVLQPMFWTGQTASIKSSGQLFYPL